MPFFRRLSDGRELRCRPLVAADLPALFELMARTDWLALTVPRAELPALAEEGLSVALERGGKLAGAALVGWSQPPVAWIRALVLGQHVLPFSALPPLLAALDNHARAAGAAQLTFMSDPGDASWLRRHLIDAGYEAVDEVIGYEKRTMAIPGWGDGELAIRPATPDDVPAIAAADRAAFPPAWVKDATILAGVFHAAPCYLVAELGGEVVGYAFATLHHHGTVAHLVRIAVAPQTQGRGAGARLLAEVVAWCRAANVSMLSLNTQLSNQHAQRLYAWFGFVRTGERQIVLNRQLAS
ncbi:MAG TPA: GNAT family N-acetyltransferase [Herpetosiphonaceae bacterium]